LQLEAEGRCAFDEIQIVQLGIWDSPEGPSPEPRMPITRRPKIWLPSDH
jgi:hypothetical protein